MDFEPKYKIPNYINAERKQNIFRTLGLTKISQRASKSFDKLGFIKISNSCLSKGMDKKIQGKTGTRRKHLQHIHQKMECTKIY